MVDSGMSENARKFMNASLNSCQEEAPHAMFILMQTIIVYRATPGRPEWHKSNIHDSEAYDRLPREEM